MRLTITTAIAAAAIGLATPASAAVLVADGVTYNLTLNSLTNGNKTANFTLLISGINTASDTEGGRTGINAFAFNDPAVGTATGGTSSGFTFQTGGLNSSGCNSTGNFYCFANSGYVLPALGAGGTTSLTFSVTTDNAGSWTDWGSTDFKIDWTGSKRNYDLVSLAIPLNTGGAVPEPATWALMMLGFGGIGMAMRRRRRQNTLMQIA